MPPSTVTIPGFEILETVHASPPRVVHRARRLSDGQAVMLKTLALQYPARREVAEIRREFDIAHGLDIEGVIEVHSLVSHGEGNLAIEMEPFGISLAEYLTRLGGPIPLPRFYAVAIGLAQILGRLHGRDVVHKDVVPRNVLIDPASGALKLIDFGISSQLSRERQSTTLSQRLEGSLPYISPEQTGRMNRDLDYRSDYYSLGVTLFELLTHQLPFSADTAIEWVHRHISQVAPFAHDVTPSVPASLSAVVAKLMHKNAEDRYQSTFGLIADLERCRDQPDAAPFELGAADISRKFQIPQRLYGRTAELEQLTAMFDDVAHGGKGLCVVSGNAGVGKSALVKELGKSIVREKGYLIKGKFDQFQQGSAHGVFALAFRALVQQILGESEARLALWRDQLKEALGANAQLIVALVPELALIIGDAPPVPELSPAEARNRFQLVFVNFVGVFATAEHPLVIFIDDLQWSDVPTLNLIQRLVTSRELHHLFVIGAHRNEGVDAGHPLRVTLNEIEKSRGLFELPLSPLDQDAVAELVADTLHADLEEARPLSQLLFERARGNPFFINELLKCLNDDRVIDFDPDQGRWRWELSAVRKGEVADNVVDFMVTSLRRLPSETQSALQLAACIGNTFDLQTLSVISELGPAASAAGLAEALKRNLVVPLNDSYTLVATDAADTSGVNPTYEFQHDRVQQAAYALIDEDLRQAVHLSVGRLVLQHSGDEEVERRLIEIVGHLNAGRGLIKGEAERLALAGLNLRAGVVARRASAHGSALELLEVGRALLPEPTWEPHYALTAGLHRELQLCAYLTGALDDAERHTQTLLDHAQSTLEKAEILSARTRQYATMGKMAESIRAGIAGLALVGVAFVDEPGPEHIAAELASVERNLAGRAIPDLIDAPLLAAPEHRTAIRLMMEIFPAAFLSGSGDLFPYLVLKSVNLSLEHGNSPESAFAYAAHGMLLCGPLKDAAAGYAYGQLAVKMIERLEDIALRARVIYVYTMFVHHWTEHWSSMTPWFLEGIESGYQSGDLLYLAYSAQDCIIWDPTLDLDVASREQRKYLRIVEDCEYQDSLDSGTLFLQMQLNFQGETVSTFSMNDASFDEEKCVAGMRERRFMTGIANYHIYKAEIHSLYGDFAGALAHVEAQDQLIASAMSLPQLVRFFIVAYVTRAALLGEMPEAERPAVRNRLRADLSQMSVWAAHCPVNFEHLRLLMVAEEARLDGDLALSLESYEASIAAAKESGYRRDEAMANELAARHLNRLGLTKAAEGYLRAARYLYYRWGAARKVEAMDQAHPHLAAVAGARRKDLVLETQTATTQSLDSAALDMASVMKASQAISGELRLEQLWKTTMQILLENAGGQVGHFVVRRDGQLVIQARGGAEPSSDAGPAIPLSVINNVLRTGKPLVLEDASTSGRFASDPYIVAHQPKSVFCVPIRRHGRFEAAIYMENNLATGAFSEDRVEVIKLLSAQASISMENAKLYEDQVRLIEAQQRFVPSQFLESLGRHDIARVELGEYVSKKMSVMFSDLRNFTPLAERLGPGEVIELLNRYFSRLGEPIAAAGGFIDSYNGDELMALFGGSAQLAVQAGVDMRRALEAFNAESTSSGGPALEMGIGVNTGSLVLGTVGGHDRLKCGVVGDTVNLASRIEQLTKTYDAPFLIGEHTLQGLGDTAAFSTRMVDRVAVKGKARAVAIHEVLDAESPARRAAKESTRERLASAMQAYLERAFDDAARQLAEAERIDPKDTALTLLRERAERYRNHPPPEDWQGFETLAHK